MTEISYNPITKRLKYLEDGKQRSRKSDLKKEPFLIKLHVICEELENEDLFLPEICTGEGWRPTIREFFTELDQNLDFRKQYKFALRAKLEKQIQEISKSAETPEKIKIKKEALKILLDNISEIDTEEDFESGGEIHFRFDSPYGSVEV